MKARNVLALLLLAASAGFAQEVKVPSYFTIDDGLSDSLMSIVKSVGLDSTFNV